MSPGIAGFLLFQFVAVGTIPYQHFVGTFRESGANSTITMALDVHLSNWSKTATHLQATNIQTARKKHGKQLDDALAPLDILEIETRSSSNEHSFAKQKGVLMPTSNRFAYWSSVSIIFAVMIATALLPYISNRSTHAALDDMQASIANVQRYENLINSLQDAETGQRGYVITGRESFLEPYHVAVSAIPLIAQSLKDSSSGTANADPTLGQILELTRLKLDELDETIKIRRNATFADVEPIITSGRGKQYMDELRLLIGQELHEANLHQNQLRDRVNATLERSAWISGVATIIDVGLLAGLLFVMNRTLRSRKRTTILLQETTNSLRESISETRHQNQQMQVTGQMLQALGAIGSLEQSSEIVSIYCAKLLPDTSGALFLYRNSRDLLEPQTRWGKREVTFYAFEPPECWALQRGTTHVSKDVGDLRCAHYQGEKGDEIVRMCCPLISQGEVIGILYVADLSHDAAAFGLQKLLIEGMAEQIALALINVQLRVKLERQSITDPLTGLFNRRYLDETLKRELSRAQRRNFSLAVIVLDLDHFKQVNDTHGHDAGDALLKSVARVVSSNIRESDLACRFGGEEIVIVLPECELEGAMFRAENLRYAIETTSVTRPGDIVLRATASFGVAVYPAHGNDAQELIHAADKALYRAKAEGRNRVLSAI